MKLVMACGAVLAAAAMAPAAADPALDKVLDCMHANVPPTVRVQEIEINATDRTGATRALKGKVYAMREKGLLRATVKVNAPQDLAGAAYLVRETAGVDHSDEMYMFLPAVNRVRRINGATADGSFLGTDFSYADIKQIENAFSDSAGKLEKPEQIEQRPVYVISFQPKAGAESRYSLLRTWVDQKSCVALKVDFYEGAGPRKELAAAPADLKQSGKYWYLSQMTMRDLKDNTKTVLRVVGVTSGDDLASRYFDAHTFYIGN